MNNYNKVKQFWIGKIKKLITDKKPSEGYHYWKDIKDTWENNLNNQKTLSDISVQALSTCRVILNYSSWTGGGYSNLGFLELLNKLKIKSEYVNTIHDTIEEDETELTTLQTKLTTYKNKWDGHVCPSGSTPCSHTDYDTIKSQRDILQTQTTNLTQEKNNLQTERDRLKEQLGGKSDYDKIKADITKQIINDSELDLSKESNLEQLIAKIKELTKNPRPDNRERERERERTISDLKKEKEQLQTQLTNKDKIIADLKKPNTETMTELKQKLQANWKQLGIASSESEKSLSEVQTYQQLVDLEQKTLADKWQEDKISLQKANQANGKLKIGLIGALVSIIILLGGLGYMVLRKKKQRWQIKERYPRTDGWW